MVADTPTTPVRWGILGAGRIAGIFANDLPFAEGAELLAVGSRDIDKANRFADEHDIPRRYGSYEELAADPDVDVVYVATPHPAHHDATIMCLEAGKHVLCEKPLAMNPDEAREMAETARRTGKFLMEAMWTRFRPVMVKVRELLAAGELGEVQYLTATIGWKSNFDPEFRLYKKELGGGGLLDGGVYPVSFASMVLGTPDEVCSVATLGESGVDENAMFAMKYASGAVAAVGVTIRSSPVSLGLICGTEGTILIDHDWHRPFSFSLRKPGREPQVFDYTDQQGVGYQFEAMHVMDCIRQGKTESDVMPLDESIAISGTMAQALKSWGVTYPSDRH